jgi:hypothetical protein
LVGQVDHPDLVVVLYPRRDVVGAVGETFRSTRRRLCGEVRGDLEDGLFGRGCRRGGSGARPERGVFDREHSTSANHGHGPAHEPLCVCWTTAGMDSDTGQSGRVFQDEQYSESGGDGYLGERFPRVSRSSSFLLKPSHKAELTFSSGDVDGDLAWWSSLIISWKSGAGRMRSPTGHGVSTRSPSIGIPYG